MLNDILFWEMDSPNELPSRSYAIVISDKIRRGKDNDMALFRWLYLKHHFMRFIVYMIEPGEVSLDSFEWLEEGFAFVQGDDEEDNTTSHNQQQGNKA